jgi:hypothetical protein
LHQFAANEALTFSHMILELEPGSNPREVLHRPQGIRQFHDHIVDCPSIVVTTKPTTGMEFTAAL